VPAACARAGELASSGASVAARTRAGAARDLAARALAREPLSAAAQAAFDRHLLVLNLAVCAGYWREVDGCIGVCADFATDTAKDGLLHLTTFYAARDAATADAAYTGPRTWDMGPPQQWTRLHQAARAGRAGRAAMLLAAGADVNVRDKTGRTALYWASINGHTAVVTALLACPAVNVNVAEVHGWTPLFEASHDGHTDIVSALLACPGVDPNAAPPSGDTPLWWASFHNRTSVVIALLAHPCILVNAGPPPDGGSTPLCAAVGQRNNKIIALLKAAGGVY